MKKDIVALVLLLLLTCAGLFNIWYLDGFISELIAQVDSSEEYMKNGDYENAEKQMRAALEEWSGAGGYTRIFIRHSEIDSAMESFYDLLGDIASEDIQASTGSYGKLRSRLMNIAAMEHVTPGSIF